MSVYSCVCVMCCDEYMCVPTFESSGRSYSAVLVQVYNGHPHHSRSKRAASERDKLLLVKETTKTLLSILYVLHRCI